ncbi:MAG: hypothetical protein ACMXYD_04235 [Candidatus Woesearchaeota archaeon]
MSRVFVLLLACLLIVLAGCATHSQPSGSGVQTSVLNRAELSNLYVPLVASELRGLSAPLPRDVFDGESHIYIGDLNLLVHNRGYADSLVALYVTGYDPNLFTVRPRGPFVTQGGSRFCYRDLILQGPYEYSVYMACALSEDIFVGGGFSRDEDYADVTVGSRGITDFLDSALGRARGEETRFFRHVSDIIGDVYVQCDVPVARPDGVSKRASCSFSSAFIDYLSRRNTRGSLLLALYGEDLSNCQNNCVVVPSPLLPRGFIAGDTADFPGGEMYTVDYGLYLNEQRWPSNYYEHDQLFQISACYLYTTYATPVVCIDATPHSSDGAVCRPGVQQINHGQPAPLRISHIDQVNQGPRVMFTIHVENTMGGTSFNPGAVDFCAPGSPELYNRELRDVAKIVDARIIGELRALDCRDGIIRLQNNRGSISCFYDLPARAFRSGAYQTTLNIEIGYLYRDMQTVQARIHRI